MKLILEKVWERTSQELLRLLDVKIGKLFSKFAKIQIECEGIDVQKFCTILNPAGLILFSVVQHLDWSLGRFIGEGASLLRALHC